MVEGLAGIAIWRVMIMAAFKAFYCFAVIVSNMVKGVAWVHMRNHSKSESKRVVRAASVNGSFCRLFVVCVEAKIKK